MNNISQILIFSFMINLSLMGMEDSSKPASLMALASKKMARSWKGQRVFSKCMIDGYQWLEKIYPQVCVELKNAVVKTVTASKLSVDKIPAMQLLCTLPTEGKFSPDGSRIVTKNNQGAIIWDSYTGNCLAKIALMRYQWSPQGRYFCMVMNDTFSYLWDTKSEKQWNPAFVRRLQPIISSVDFTADERYMFAYLHSSPNAQSVYLHKYPYIQEGKLLKEKVIDTTDPRGQWVGIQRWNSAIDEDFNAWTDIDSLKPVLTFTPFDSPHCNFSPDGRLFYRLDRIIDETTVYWDLFDRQTGQHIQLPLPTWDWDDGSVSIYINKDNSRILLYEYEWQESMVVDIAERKIIYEEHINDKEKYFAENENHPELSEGTHIYSRDLSKVIYFQLTPDGGTRIEVKDFSGNVLHAWNFDIPLKFAHHAVDEDHMTLIYKNWGDNCHRLKILVNINTGQVLCRDVHKGGYNLGYGAAGCFSSDGKYLSVDPITERVSIWQLPPTLDANKHSLAEIMAYRILENNRIADDKPSDAARKVLLQSSHKELRSFAQALHDKNLLQHGIHRRTQSLT